MEQAPSAVSRVSNHEDADSSTKLRMSVGPSLKAFRHALGYARIYGIIVNEERAQGMLSAAYEIDMLPFLQKLRKVERLVRAAQALPVHERAYDSKNKTFYDTCNTCDEDWPCRTSLLHAAADECRTFLA